MMLARTASRLYFAWGVKLVALCTPYRSSAESQRVLFDRLDSLSSQEHVSLVPLKDWLMTGGYARPTFEEQSRTGFPITLEVDGNMACSLTRSDKDYLLARMDRIQAGLTTLFMFGDSVHESSLLDLMTKDVLRIALAWDLLVLEPVHFQWSATVQLMPLQKKGTYAVGERCGPLCHASWCEPASELRPDWHVQRVLADTMALIYSVPPLSAAVSVKVLDLCSGNGGQGIHAAATYADHATLVDLNPRSLRFEKFGALLSGVMKDIDVVQGDLYSGLPSSCSSAGQFDVILSNPPYQPASGECRANVASDGGASGEEILQRIVTGASRHLAPHGRMHIVTWLINIETYASKLLSWWPAPCGRNLTGIPCLEFFVYHGYVFGIREMDAHFGCTTEDCPCERAWDQQGIQSIAPGFIFAKASESATASRVTIRLLSMETKNGFILSKESIAMMGADFNRDQSQLGKDTRLWDDAGSQTIADQYTALSGAILNWQGH